MGTNGIHTFQEFLKQLTEAEPASEVQREA